MNFDQTARQLCANAIGNYIITYLDCLSDEAIAHMTELCAVQLLRRIKEILDDEALDDPTCFQRIDAIVSAWHEAGLETDRHWECE
ncbi:MAG TPA: hypothetical protein H9941_01480 [Candidatus Flavonifractor avistercoris]|uniref:hypothetical protein n=1 Tax=Flavonifractor sp. TaxID=2049025 RepID=UPI0017496EB1|nr:hypothetical protein [Flavonifractor sp.]HJB69486.1 hypothetical protein [Candidatus Flavonifractor avistercoris]